MTNGNTPPVTTRTAPTEQPVPVQPQAPPIVQPPVQQPVQQPVYTHPQMMNPMQQQQPNVFNPQSFGPPQHQLALYQPPNPQYPFGLPFQQVIIN